VGKLQQKFHAVRGHLILALFGIVTGVATGAPALAATGAFDGTAIGMPLAGRPLAPAEPDKVTAPITAGNPLWGIPLSTLSSTRERPLFSPSRRPPPAAVVTAAPPPPPPPPKPVVPDHPALTLVGTIVGKTMSIGVFIDQATKQVVRLRTGEGHANWTLRAIDGREAILDNDRQEATLALPPTNGSDQPAASAPGAMAAAAPPQTRMGDAERPTTLVRSAPGPAASAPAATAPAASVSAKSAPGTTPGPRMPGPAMTGSVPSGPEMPGPVVSGPAKPASMMPGPTMPTPAMSEPAMSGPAMSGPAIAGPAMSGPAATGSVAPAAKPVDQLPSVHAEDGHASTAPATADAADGASPGAAPAAAWIDGDGRAISPPPQILTENKKPDGEPAPPWLDGDGEAISPPPSVAVTEGGGPTEAASTTWIDGDGQSIASPPPNATQHKPVAWIDGDGQIVSPR
jgi:general secretion pathway protein N